MRNKHQQKNIIKDLVVEDLYYIGETLFAIKARYLYSNETFYRYSDDYLSLLQMTEPISLKDFHKNLNTDEILDKINALGLNSLTKSRVGFFKE